MKMYYYYDSIQENKYNIKRSILMNIISKQNDK